MRCFSHVMVRNHGCINCSHDTKSRYPFYTQKIILNVANNLHSFRCTNIIKSKYTTSIHLNNCSWVTGTSTSRKLAETEIQLRLVRCHESLTTPTPPAFSSYVRTLPAKFEMPINVYVSITQAQEATTIACTQQTPKLHHNHMLVIRASQQNRCPQGTVQIVETLHWQVSFTPKVDRCMISQQIPNRRIVPTEECRHQFIIEIA